LLDEVDLHLHPEWQRQLLQFLSGQLPNFQFLATTHSPFTAHQCGPEALHIVERLDAKKAPSIRQYGGDARLLRLDQLLDPLLGLETTDSLETEKLREEYLTLKVSPKRDAKRFATLKAQLEERPSAQQALMPKEVQRQFAMLTRLEKSLGKQR
jgi:hypothetical protein